MECYQSAYYSLSTYKTEEFSPKALVMGVFSLKIRILLEKAIPKSIHIVATFATIFFPRTDEVTKYLC